MITTDDWIRFYPEIQSRGSLRLALTEALAKVGSPLIANDPADWFSKYYARVEVKPRFAQVYVAALCRLFLIEFWSHGVCMVSGNCADLAPAAAAIHQWVADPRSRVSQLSSV